MFLKSLLNNKAISIKIQDANSPITSPITAISQEMLLIKQRFENKKTQDTLIICSTNWVMDGIAVCLIE